MYWIDTDDNHLFHVCIEGKTRRAACGRKVTKRGLRKQPPVGLVLCADCHLAVNPGLRQAQKTQAGKKRAPLVPPFRGNHIADRGAVKPLPGQQQMFAE
ncbi:MAG TPA: hypothetical protein VMY37_04410 [Thermoguttaceae bacterium]|nr:hypothetical protein [Thermoguttaceae bacterium]